ncbi:MAG: RNA-binding protein, partial [Nitrososphaera sp.]
MSSSSSSAGIQSSLEEINKSLKDIQERREKLIKGTRDVIMLCSKSIVAMHHGQLEEAKNKMDDAKLMLEDFRTYARHDLYRHIAVAEQELVEAYALKSVMDDLPMPSMSELHVTGESYLT